MHTETINNLLDKLKIDRLTSLAINKYSTPSLDYLIHELQNKAETLLWDSSVDGLMSCKSSFDQKVRIKCMDHARANIKQEVEHMNEISNN